MVGLIKSQIRYASRVNPEGDIAPAWSAFLRYTVDREAYRKWADDRKTDGTLQPRLLADDLWPERPTLWFSIKEFLRGCFP